jgi:hypothetical protein
VVLCGVAWAGSLGLGLGLVSGAWRTDSIVDAARCVQTTGFGLPVVNAAVNASRQAALAATTIGATRHGRKPAIARSA